LQLTRFSFNNNTNNGNNNADNARVSFRKVGIKISNLVRVEGKKKPPQQKNLVRLYLIALMLVVRTSNQVDQNVN
jgi:hypothetical protein